MGPALARGAGPAFTAMPYSTGSGRYTRPALLRWARRLCNGQALQGSCVLPQWRACPLAVHQACSDVVGQNEGLPSALSSLSVARAGLSWSRLRVTMRATRHQESTGRVANTLALAACGVQGCPNRAESRGSSSQFVILSK